eukprot:364417-Chlamydomonas_euryale.AAC.4
MSSDATSSAAWLVDTDPYELMSAVLLAGDQRITTTSSSSGSCSGSAYDCPRCLCHILSCDHLHQHGMHAKVRQQHECITALHARVHARVRAPCTCSPLHVVCSMCIRHAACCLIHVHAARCMLHAACSMVHIA